MNSKQRFIILFLFLMESEADAYHSVSEDACPANLSECLTGDNHVVACYQSVEKIRVSMILFYVILYGT